MRRVTRAGIPSTLVRIGGAARPLLVAACLAVCQIAGVAPASAADTDLVVLRNGDRLQGEAKRLQYGRLEFKTSTMSTVYIEWDKVEALVSPNTYELETTDGARYFGSLARGAAGSLTVELEGRTTPVPLQSVVRIRRIKSSFWDRLDGSINLGASYTKSSGVGQGSLSASVGTRRRAFEFSTDFATSVTVQPNEEDKSRTALSVSYNRLLSNRWFVPGTGKLERNTDLGLDLRSSVGGGFGRYFVQTNRSLLGAAGGVLVNRENPVEGDSTVNVEAFLGALYEFFTYDTPKTKIDVTVVLLPSLNVGGRYRTELNLTLSREIVKDFTVGVTGYDSYDSKPPQGSSSTHDLGVSLTVGWTF